MVKVIWTPAAIEDLEEIADYIAKDSVKYAYRQILKILDRVTVLEDYPRIGRVVPEIKSEIIRELIEGNYRIVYKIVNSSRIDIIRVIHGARLLKI